MVPDCRRAAAICRARFRGDQPAEAGEELPPPGAALKLPLWASAAGTLVLGIFPSAILGFVETAAGVR